MTKDVARGKLIGLVTAIAYGSYYLFIPEERSKAFWIFGFIIGYVIFCCLILFFFDRKH